MSPTNHCHRQSRPGVIIHTNYGCAAQKRLTKRGGIYKATKFPSYTVAIIFDGCGCVLVLFLAYWIFEKIFFYLMARSYIQEIADVFDLNRHLATAIVYLTFVAIAFFGAMIFRFSKQKRLIGVLGIISLLIVHSLIMWWGTSGEIISTKGEALKCYVITRDAVRYGERPGIDPGTGRQCRPVKPELVERLREYEKGNRPKRIVENNPVFFNLGTGEPIVWYYKNKDGGIEIFDLMGFHPATGEELLPVTREVVEDWRRQRQEQAREPPQLIFPDEKYAFFDPITGKPRAWYWKNESGDYDFYDRAGFHPRTGEPLSVVTRDVIEDWRKSAAQQCYIITRDAVKYGNHPGIDQETGKECRPVTPGLLPRLLEYAKGNRPKRIEAGNPTFFDRGTGEPIVWYYKNKDGDIEIFDLMGFHPATGEELLPVTREIVEAWQQQVARQAPQLIDPHKYAFFDPATGKARVWYRRSENGDYEFYDRAGFHPLTGEPLTIITRGVIDDWRKYASQKCYIITRDAVKYGNHPGIDQETGKECRPVTPGILPRLLEYAKGNRPKRIEAGNPTFFDRGTGEPIVWYYKNKDGGIQIFDLMGFHPESGDELLPVNKEIVDLWKNQGVPPNRVDPNNYSFFDDLTGKPRVWYWRSEKGEYEFYDKSGFHKATGEPLKLLTKDAIEQLKKDTESRQKQLENERLQREQEQRDRTARLEQERNERVKAEERERQARADQIQRETQAANLCDQLAASPTDSNRAGNGVPFALLKTQAREAVENCQIAVRQYPNELRFQYQLARALSFGDRNKAFAIHSQLVRLRYPAAYDNLGWLYFKDRKDIAEAVKYFRMGTQLGDPDSMVSLAEMIGRGYTTSINASEGRIELYERAAGLGSEVAARALQVEKEKEAKAEQELIIQQQQQEMALRMFGTILRNIPRY